MSSGTAAKGMSLGPLKVKAKRRSSFRSGVEIFFHRLKRVAMQKIGGQGEGDGKRVLLRPRSHGERKVTRPRFGFAFSGFSLALCRVDAAKTCCRR